MHCCLEPARSCLHCCLEPARSCLHCSLEPARSCLHYLAYCKEQACQERHDAWASLDVERSTMLTWLLLWRMPTRRWAPAHHRVGMNGGQSPEQLYVPCVRMYCRVIQLFHDDDPQNWSYSIVMDVQFYADFVAALSAVMFLVFMCHVFCCQPASQQLATIGQRKKEAIASNAMTRIQTISCFFVREPGATLSPLAIRFECVQILVFC